ncbi:MAG: hypothetical protein QNJ46_17830 [Leptolyngbyaceae cyanobacterium MO_188.B28]|nr:hypothetical protein [Leptolyngbyaceae cyanobacterium MO_188.B28]
MNYPRYGALVIAVIGIIALFSSHYVAAAFLIGLLIGLVISSWITKQKLAKAFESAKLDQRSAVKDDLYQQSQKDVQSHTIKLTQNLSTKEKRINELEQELAKALESITQITQKVKEDELNQQSHSIGLTQNLTAKEQRINELEQELAKALKSITLINQMVKEKDELYQQSQRDAQSHTIELTENLAANQQRISELEQELAKAIELSKISQDRIKLAPMVLDTFNTSIRLLPGNPNYFVAKSDAEHIQEILEKLTDN